MADENAIIETLRKEFRDGFETGEKDETKSDAYKAGVAARMGGAEFYFINLSTFISNYLNEKS